MLKKWIRSAKNFFSPLQTGEHYHTFDYTPRTTLATTMIDAILPEAEGEHRKTMERIELARLAQERDTANNNLMAQHKTMIVTVIATLIALFSSVSAIFIALQKDTPPAPIVNVTPAQPTPADIKVYVTPQPTDEQTPETPR